MGPTQPEALTFGSKLWSDFYFSEKGIPILRFFLGLMIFTFVGALVYFYGLVPVP
jgi:hypothetical protein